MTGGVDADFHVVVVGAGNAALCAPTAPRTGRRRGRARECGAIGPGWQLPLRRGDFRFVHDGLDDLRGLLPDLSDADGAKLTVEPYSGLCVLDYQHHGAR